MTVYGREKWKNISESYNKLGEGVFESLNEDELNAKWRNILYRARILKQPDPIGDHKSLKDETELNYRIEQMKLHPRFSAIKIGKKTSSKLNTNTARSLNTKHGIFSPINRHKKLKLEEVKRQFGLGMK